MASTPPPLGPSVPTDTADPPAEQDVQKDVVLFHKTAVKVLWTRPTPDAAPTSQDASLSIRHNAALTEAFLSLRVLHVWLHGKQHSTVFYIIIFPEDMDSLFLVDTGDEYRLDFRMRRPPRLFGPDCAWEGMDEAQTATLRRLDALALQAIFAVAVQKHRVNKAQLEVFCRAASNGSIQPIRSLYNTARHYGGKGGRLHRPDSSALLHPPPYVPEEAVGSAASDASAPAYENKAPGNHSQATTGESSHHPRKRRCSSTRALARRPHKRPRSSARALARRPRKRPRSSRSSPEVETASAGCRKCDERFPFLTQKLGDITTQLTQLTEMNRRMNTRTAAVEAHLAAQAQARAAADGARSAAVVEEVRRSALVEEVRESLVYDVTEIIRSQFVESEVVDETVAATVNAEMDVLVGTVAAQIDAEMDGVRDYLDRLKENLKEYIAIEMRAEGERSMETILQRTNEARVPSDL